jgi:hypothetical protein
LLLGDHGHAQAHQRAHVGGPRAVGARHQHHVVLGGQPGHHLHDTRVLGARQLLDRSSSATFCVLSSVAIGSVGAVQHAAAGHPGAGHLHAPVLPGRGDRAHGARRVDQRGLGEVVGIGEGGLLAGHRAHAHALVDAEAAALDDAFFQAPALVARGLEVQVGVVDAVLADHPSARVRRPRPGRKARASAPARWPGVRGWVRG